MARGEALSSVSSEFNITRQSLRRHMGSHMGQPIEHLRDSGLGPYEVVLRLVQTADRLHDLADQAEERGRLADAVRATLAESKGLHQLLTMGLQGGQQIEFAEDADALEKAVASLVRRAPSAGDIIADELESRGRDSFAAKVRDLAERVRLHQAERQELSHAHP